MASELDDGPGYAEPEYLRVPGAWEERMRVARSEAADPAAPPARRPTSHRRVTPRPHVRLRTTAILAFVTGLAITTPLLLRPHKDEIALGPEATAPGGGVTPGAEPSTAASSATVGDAATGSRSATPVSRNLSRSPAAGPSSVRTSAGQSSPDQAAAFENQVVTLTNAQRTAHGCPALRADARLQAAAIAHSLDMRVRSYFAHDSPDGGTPWARIEAQGYSDPSAENIAMGQGTPQAVVDAWMNSPGHRANILNCSSKAIGVGVQFGPGGPWWTQDFGYS